MNTIYTLFNKYSKLSIQIKATLWFMLCLFLQKGISFIATPVFTRIMNPSEFGAYNVWLSWFGVASVLVSLNLFCGVYTSGIIKFSDDRKNYSQSLVSLNLTLCILWFVFYLIFSEHIDALLGCSNIQMMLMIFLIWTSSIYSFWASEQRVDLKYKHMVFVTLLLSVSKPIVCVFFVLNSNDKVSARIIGVGITEAIICTPLILHYLCKGNAFFNFKYWKYALFFNIPLIPHYLSQVIITNSDRIMISYFDGNKAAGIYSLGASVSQVVSVFCTAFFMSVEPWLYKKLNNNDLNNISNIVNTIVAIIAILNFMLIIMAPEAVKIFAPSDFYDAIWLIPALACSSFFMFQYTLYAVFEMFFKQTHLIALATFICATINIAGNYLFIPKFGYQAAAYTSLVSYIASSFIHYFFMRKICIKNFGISVVNIRSSVLLSVILLVLSAISISFYSHISIRYLLFLALCFVLISQRNKFIGLKKIVLSRFYT